MTVASPRLFVADFDLIGYSGHFFNQVFGFREAARARGIETRIYISRKADPRIAEELDAHALLPSIPWRDISQDAFLESLADAQRALKPLWSDLDTARVSERDVLVITSSRPQVIFSIGQWLRSRPASARPAVVFRFFGPEFYDFGTDDFNTEAWTYHFASRSLFGAPGEDRIFFTLNNAKALRHLERLCLRQAFYLPVPKYYGAIVEHAGMRTAQPLTIYVHVNRKSGPMSDRVIELVTKVLRRHSGVKFLIRFCEYVYGDDVPQNKIDGRHIGSGIEILPAEQNHIDYLAAIDRADMILLPYDPIEYRGIVSGIFCEAAAMGKVAIIPSGTWMADHITEARASGVLFDRNNVDDMMEAVERAMRERKRLQDDADRLASSFREENSCAGNLDGMLELAGQSHDMRLPYVPLTDATKALGSRLYLGEGWDQAEEGRGVWSDGDRAEINLSLKPCGQALLFTAQVRPFLAAGHSRIDVSLTANEMPLAEWSFDAERPGDRSWSWCRARIPEDIAASGDIQIVLHVRSPASPKALGLSADPRKLGIALRQFSLMPEMQSSEVQLPENLSIFTRLRERIKHTWKQASSSPK